MTATKSLSAAGSGRQPDYFVGSSGIPRLVVGAANSRRNMNRQNSSPVADSVVGTDPVKLNKCLYNLTVRNRGSGGGRSGSKTESDIAIRSQYSNKSNSSTRGSSSNRNNNGNSTGTALSVSSTRSALSSSSTTITTTTVIATGLSNNRGNSVTSSPSSSSPFTPRSGSFSHNLGSCNGISGGVRIHRREHSTLLSGRQRRNVAGMGDTNRFADDDDTGNGMMRQCRFTVAVRKAGSSTADNRLNYQRKYDRTIFGYNRLEQFVLPPLQI